MAKTPKVIYFRESLAQSIAADVFTFGVLVGIMMLNFKYWSGHWYVTVALLLLWMSFVWGRASAVKHDFYSFDEAIKYLQAEKKKK